MRLDICPKTQEGVRKLGPSEVWDFNSQNEKPAWTVIREFGSYSPKYPDIQRFPTSELKIRYLV